MGSDAITLNFSKELDSADCFMWVLDKFFVMFFAFGILSYFSNR